MVKAKKSLTIPSLIKAMKKAGFPTKRDVEDIVFEKLTEFHAEMTKPTIEKTISTALGELKEEIKATENNLSGEIDGLKAEFSTVLSREEFEKLKRSVSSIQ